MAENKKDKKLKMNLPEDTVKELAEVAAIEAEALSEGEQEASTETQKGSNKYIRAMMESNFVEYASYVIKDRAIPDVDDGLKPVQRRILWSLHRMDDGKFHKVANVIGHTMQYHPHGDAAIGDALVVVANKEYFLEKQGNFGNIFTGDCASAPRYIETRLSPIGREVLFNESITELTDSYDGRNKEPVVLPVKIPSLLMLGAEGIAVVMSTRIMPHNFCELLQAQIAVLRGEDFELYPDFQQGGMMDVSEYEEGNGKITLRAKIDLDGRKLIIREIPATTNTEKLIASVEKAAEKSKIKIASINDFTAEQVEIEIVPMRGYDPEKALQALYTYTDCAVSVSVNMMVICENRPVQMNVHSVIERNTRKLQEYLQRELEIELKRQEELFHAKTLAQIFIENRIYKRIENCDSSEKIFAEIYKGLEPFRKMLKRDVNDDDIEKLLSIQIRRISLFDIRKNQEELAEIVKTLETINHNLKHLKAYAIKYIQALLDKYGAMFPRRTRIETFNKIDRKAAALNNIKVGWDRKGCYIGTNIKSDDCVTCNEFDRLLCVERNGNYKIINIPEKIFIDRLYDFRKYDPTLEFGIIYKDTKSGKCYGKRCVVNQFITDKQYRICPPGCRLELITPRPDSIYTLSIEHRMKDKRQIQVNLKELPLRTPKARGLQVTVNPLTKPPAHLRYLEPEELLAFAAEVIPSDDDNEPGENNLSSEVVSDADAAVVVTTTVATVITEPEAPEEDIAVIPEAVAPVAEKPAAKAGRKSKASASIVPVDEPAPQAVEPPVVEAVEPVKTAKAPKPDKKSKAPVEVVPVEETPIPQPEETIPAAKPGRKKKTVEPEIPEVAAVPPAVVAQPVATPPVTPDSSAKSKPEKNSKPGKPDDEGDEFGIIQPEFGF